MSTYPLTDMYAFAFARCAYISGNALLPILQLLNVRYVHKYIRRYVYMHIVKPVIYLGWNFYRCQQFVIHELVIATDIICNTCNMKL